jgi:hypothetical protein
MMFIGEKQYKMRLDDLQIESAHHVPLKVVTSDSHSKLIKLLVSNEATTDCSTVTSFSPATSCPKKHPQYSAACFLSAVPKEPTPTIGSEQTAPKIHHNACHAQITPVHG